MLSLLFIPSFGAERRRLAYDSTCQLLRPTLLTYQLLGEQGKARGHLQTSRVLRQGIPRCREGEDSSEQAEQTRRIILC
jgi:hypothetical protein